VKAEAFEALLEEREDLRQRHEDWCAECSAGESSAYARKRRDETYAALEQVDARIEAELQAERATQVAS
jgi:hypothetical protein